VQTRENVGFELKRHCDFHEVFSYANGIFGDWHTFTMTPTGWKPPEAS
jgi:hypothetical protein